jgi:hypothetical protein
VIAWLLIRRKKVFITDPIKYDAADLMIVSLTIKKGIPVQSDKQKVSYQEQN